MFKHLKFAGVPVADQDRAVGFYRDTLGLELAYDQPYDKSGWRWIEFAIPGAKTRVLFEKPRPQAGSEPALIFIVDDVEKTHAELSARGVSFTQPPVSAPWDDNELFAIFRDSEGNLLRIGGRRAAG